jgi:hypothetical protein
MHAPFNVNIPQESISGYIGLTQKADLPLFDYFAKQNLPQTLTKALWVYLLKKQMYEYYQESEAVFLLSFFTT